MLDVASGPGSFPSPLFGCRVVALDEDAHAFDNSAETVGERYSRAFGRSDFLPFAAATFDLVVCHHSLEHIEALDATLREIERILKPSGRLYVSVPNGFGLCDGIFRWIFDGGGHVNQFSQDSLRNAVERNTTLKLVQWQRLYSSFVYLNRLTQMLALPDVDVDLGRRQWLRRVPPGWIAGAQRILYLGTRYLDRALGTHSAEYGWIFYFTRNPRGTPPEQAAYLNVCMACGCGHQSADLKRVSRLRFQCSNCGALTAYVEPFRGAI